MKTSRILKKKARKNLKKSIRMPIQQYNNLPKGPISKETINPELSDYV